MSHLRLTLQTEWKSLVIIVIIMLFLSFLWANTPVWAGASQSQDDVSVSNSVQSLHVIHSSLP
jgi:hypothetical protein